MQPGQVFLLRNTVSGVTLQNQETGSFGCSILHEVQIYNICAGASSKGGHFHIKYLQCGVRLCIHEKKETHSS